MALTWTQTDKLDKDIGVGHSGLSNRVSASQSLLYAVFLEHETNADALDVRLAAAEALLANAKTTADLNGLRALSTTDFVDGQPVFQEDISKLYIFDLGATVGSEDPPYTVDATDGGGVYRESEGMTKFMHDPVENIMDARAIAGVDLVNGMMVLILDNGVGTGLYYYDSASILAETLPQTITVTAGGKLFSAAPVGYIPPVLTTTLLAALDVAGALSAGSMCNVTDRGDGHSAAYSYTVGATPALDYGTIGTVGVYVDGTNGYWKLADLAAYIALAEAFDRQRLGAVSGGMIGDASTWYLSLEASTGIDHGFAIDVTGASSEEVTVTDAIKDLCTSIALTESYLNIAIGQQATGNNARARVVYDDAAGKYALVFPHDVDVSSLAIGAPATANDIGLTAMLGITTGVGILHARIPRENFSTMAANGTVAAIIGTAAANKAQSDTLLKYIRTLGVGVPSVITVDTGVAAQGIGVFTALGLTSAPYGMEIIGARVVCAAANLNGTVELRDTAAGAGNLITDAIPCEVKDMIGQPGRIDLATNNIAAAGEIYLWKNATADSGRVFITIVRTA